MNHWLPALVALASLFLAQSHAYLTLRRIGNAVSRGARCLDGSGAAYYLFRNTNSERWIIHLETGTSACFGPGAAFCNLFTNPASGGSSLQYPCALPELQSSRLSDVGQLVSSDSRRNPEFYNDNRVFVPHCSGDLFTGQNVNGTAYGGVYFGGHHIVQAVLEDLINIHGLGNANQVLFGGAAMGAITHADFVRQMLPDSVQLAVFTDGIGLAAYNTFSDVQAQISASLGRGDVDNFINSFVPNLSDSGITALYDTLRVFDPYIPPGCLVLGNGNGGLECFDVSLGVQLGVQSSVAIFVFGSIWDTSQLATFLGLERYTCASETGLLTDEEQVYVRLLGTSNYVRLRNTAFLGPGRVVSLYIAHCFTNTLLEDNLLCTQVNGTTAYEAVVSFISEALQGRSQVIAEQFNPTGLTCSENCGASQCTWDSNATRTPDMTATCNGRLDGFPRFREGTACPGEVLPQYAASTATQSTMTRYTVMNATSRNAVCLDGSPAGYYVHRNASSSNWIIHLQGGGLCSNGEECQAFIRTTFGSSNAWQCSLPNTDQDGTYATLGQPVHDDSDFNPAFYQWNRVYVRYCTGDIFLGQQPQATNPLGVHHTGHYVILGVLEDLVARHGLLGGELIVLGGTSAGGVGSQMHVDDFREQLAISAAALGRPAPRVFAYSDGGWFRSVPSLADFAAFPETAFGAAETIPNGVFAQTQFLFTVVFNIYLDASCNAAVEPAMAFTCAAAEVLWPRLDTPTFMISSLWDTFEMQRLFGVPRFVCASTTQHISAVERDYLVRSSQFSLNALPVFSARNNSVFFPTCVSHAHFGFAVEFGITGPCDEVNGVSAYGALTAWVGALAAGSPSPPPVLGAEPVGFRCDAACTAIQCAWALTPDTANTSCPNQVLGEFAASPFYVGPACSATPVTTEAPPFSTTPPVSLFTTPVVPSSVTPTSSAPPVTNTSASSAPPVTNTSASSAPPVTNTSASSAPPVTATPVPAAACPEAVGASTDQARYEYYLACWQRLFAEQQAAFSRYVAGQCV